MPFPELFSWLGQRSSEQIGSHEEKCQMCLALTCWVGTELCPSQLVPLRGGLLTRGRWSRLGQTCSAQCAFSLWMYFILFHCIIMLLICCPYRRTLVDSQCEMPQIVCASALKVFGMASGTSVKVFVLVAVAMLTCITGPSENWDPTLLVEIQVLNHGAVCRPKSRVLPLSFKKA